MTTESPAERSLRGRTAVLKSWAKTADWSARTEPGRIAAEARFEREVDPGGVLPPAERAKRADAARRARMSELARLSVKARREKRDAAKA
jgi:hypothetical protein